jgi:hypothetical protein
VHDRALSAAYFSVCSGRRSGAGRWGSDIPTSQPAASRPAGRRGAFDARVVDRRALGRDRRAVGHHQPVVHDPRERFPVDRLLECWRARRADPRRARRSGLPHSAPNPVGGRRPGSATCCSPPRPRTVGGAGAPARAARTETARLRGRRLGRLDAALPEDPDEHRRDPDERDREENHALTMPEMVRGGKGSADLGVVCGAAR